MNEISVIYLHFELNLLISMLTRLINLPLVSIYIALTERFTGNKDETYGAESLPPPSNFENLPFYRAEIVVQHIFMRQLTRPRAIGQLLVLEKM